MATTVEKQETKFDQITGSGPSKEDKQKIGIQVFGQENTTALAKGTKKGIIDITQNERKTLKTIQPAKDGSLTRNSDEMKKNKNNLGGKRNPKSSVIEIYQDPELETKPQEGKETCSCNCHKSAEEEAMELMGDEKVPAQYWKDLAEERRKALDDSLLENELLNQRVEDLVEENQKLSGLASQAEYFAEVLRNIAQEDDSPDSSTE